MFAHKRQAGSALCLLDGSLLYLAGSPDKNVATPLHFTSIPAHDPQLCRTVSPRVTRIL
jgi:hypothetical protein